MVLFGLAVLVATTLLLTTEDRRIRTR